ncbi:response regulator [Haloferula chungangensis]|uniref:Response regulator n=1 Tax=Haloferula chungangensis TaxID=1048331 RepID=A0ABW2L8Q7_9BACT
MKKILILEDKPEIRSWLEKLVAAAFPTSGAHHAACLAELSDGLIRERSFDLALIDLGLPDGSGLDGLRQIKSLSPDTLCVIVTIMGDDSQVVASLAAGADGYLLKDQPPEQIQVQLRNISLGLPAISPTIARRIAKHFSLTGPSSPDESTLTARENEILSLISRGHRNVDVATALGISENTVASHIKSIYRKLSISSRAEASWHATRLGL